MGRLNMKDSLKDFRDASNLILKDIYATDELKKMTLEKCKNQKKDKIKPILAAAASVAFLIIGFSYNYLYNKSAIANNYTNESKKQEYKNIKDTENIKAPLKTKDNKDLAKSTNSSSNNKNKNETGVSVDTKSDATTANTITGNETSSNTTTNSNAESTKNSNNVSSSENVAENNSVANENETNRESSTGFQGLAALQKNLNISTAEKYFESKILTPAYVPKGFNLTDISIPDTKLKCIKLRYSSDDSYFQIYESKNLSTLEGESVISIQNSKAYINYTKGTKDTITTQITWIKNNIQYSLSSTLPENSLINIAKSIN
jgi:cytoskeletal protein RodZ